MFFICKMNTLNQPLILFYGPVNSKAKDFQVRRLYFIHLGLFQPFI